MAQQSSLYLGLQVRVVRVLQVRNCTLGGYVVCSALTWDCYYEFSDISICKPVKKQFLYP